MNNLKDFDYLYSDSVIYGIRDPRTNEIRYVGKTFNFEKRKASHLIPSSLRKDTLLAKWLKGLIDDKVLPDFFIIDSDIPYSVSLMAEQSWINYYSERGCDLLNINLPTETRWRKKLAALLAT
jgi:hypothetical protein